MPKSWWLEDKFTPRVDALDAPVDLRDRVIRVRHPEWFRRGDIIRLGEEDRYPTGELDEHGNDIFRVRNETALVTDISPAGLSVLRALGANDAQTCDEGQPVTIIAGGHPHA